MLRTAPKDPQALMRLIVRWYEGGNACPGLDHLLESLSTIEFMNAEKIIALMQKHLALSLEASAVFLAAYGLWASKKFHTAVQPDAIIQMLCAEGIILTDDDLDEAIQQLCTAGLCRPDERYAICFSRTGTRFGRKLLACGQGVMT